MVEEEDFVGEHAYVALLHGDRYHFLLYALALGNRLRRLDERTPRILLVGKALPEQEAPFLEGEILATLSALWQVQPVDMIDAPAADKTSRKRHRYVFTKLRALEVPYRKLLFFDLDIVVRKNPEELFEVPAPAGMFHGNWSTRREVRHGELIPPKALGFGSGCVNAGLLRLDPPCRAKARKQLVDEMVAEVLTIADQSYLPEQYYLVQKLPGWRHIEVAWNCEVNARTYMESRAEKPAVQEVEMPWDWFELGETQEQLRENVGMFHFSGNYLEPWWFLAWPSTEAQEIVEKQFRQRDPRGMIALAVADWLRAVEELREDHSGTTLRKEAELQTNELVEWVSERFEWVACVWWADCAKPCKICGLKDISEDEICEECAVRDAIIQMSNDCTEGLKPRLCFTGRGWHRCRRRKASEKAMECQKSSSGANSNPGRVRRIRKLRQQAVRSSQVAEGASTA